MNIKVALNGAGGQRIGQRRGQQRGKSQYFGKLQNIYIQKL